jgi:Bacterial Ig-like domain (group 3)
LSVSNMNAATTMLSIGTLAPSSSPSTTFIGARRPGWEGTWPPGSWTFAVADGLAVLLLSLSDGRKKRRLAGALGMAGLLLLVLSCGSSGGGGGGGGGGGAATTLTLTTSIVKAQAGTTFTLTATVHSTNPVSGYVYFFDNTLNTDIQGVPVNGVSTVQLNEVLIGTHVMTAQYSGDANNQASQTTGSINQVITGTGQLLVNATGVAFSHSSTINVTIQ